MKLLKYSIDLIRIGARSSKLAMAQVEEVRNELLLHGIDIPFIPILVASSGDLDKTTSLREMEKSDFFTKEVDDLLISGRVDIAIHSAKDLPERLPSGLAIIALTRGQDPSDSLVMEEEYSIVTLPKNARIGTSSIRREENLRAIRKDFEFIDIRGTIDERLDLLRQKKVDALVIAEAALIRLKYDAIHREKIEGPVAENQGRLAIVAKEDDRDLQEIFKTIDARRNDI